MSWEPAWRVRGEAPPWGQAAVVLAFAFAVVYLFWVSRGLVFLEDEWAMILERREGTLDSFLEPHNEHLVVVNVAIYKALMVTFGIDDYAPYRAVVILAHLVCLVLVFRLARPRVGTALAAAVTAPLLVFGPGWEILLFPFGIFFLGSVLCGLGMMVAFDRGDRRGDVVASILLGVAFLGSSFGIPLAIGAAGEILWRRDRWRRIWIVAIPVVLWGIWYVAYDPSANRPVPIDVTEAPRFVFMAASGALSALIGLPLGVETQGRAEHGLLKVMSWGLLVAVVGAVVWHVRRTRTISPRLVMIVVTLGSFWALTGAARGVEHQWYTGRYLYPAAVFLAVGIAEVLRGVELPRSVIRWACVVAAGAAVLNAGWLYKDGNGRRVDASVLRAELAAAELARSRTPKPLEIDVRRAQGLRMGQYFRTIDDLGSPAPPPATLPSATPEARRAVDDLLIKAWVRISPLPVAPRPLFTQEVGGSAAEHSRPARGCLVVRPPAGQAVTAELKPPPYGLAVRARNPGAFTVRYRRFADGWSEPPLRLLPAANGTLLGSPPDALPAVPWRVQITGAGRFTLC